MSEFRFKQYNENPIELIKEYCTESKELNAALNELDGWGIGQAEEFAELLGLGCESDNTYNNSDLTLHLNNHVQWHVLSNADDSIYDENAILLVEEHGGGDIRGNYNSMRAFKFNKHCTLSDLYCSLYVDSEEIELK